MFPKIFLKAPPLLIPLPFNVKASAPIVIPPYNSKAAPSKTVVPVEAFPNPEVFVI